MSGNEVSGLRRRANVMAGVFYPEERKEAEAALDGFSVHAGHGGLARAIIAPHAGWDISGKIAAAAFTAAAGRDPSTVVILGPIHERDEEGIILSDSGSFETPLGDIPVDLELCEEFETCGTCFVTNDIPHLAEHSIEILLPFVKRCFPDASLVPVLIGGARPSSASALSRGLDLVFGPIADTTLFIVSTNLCDHLEAASSRVHADAFLKLLLEGDRDGIFSALETGKISACGAVACAALLGTRTIANRRPRLVAETSSSEKGGEARKSVHYAAVAFE